MKASDKAEQLIENFISIIGTDIIIHIKAKQCALIVVENILATKNFPNTLHPDFVNFENKYWAHVREYIVNS